MKRIIPLVCLLVFLICFSSCEPEDNATLYKKAYEQGNTQDQVIYALGGGYLKERGFSKESGNDYSAMIKTDTIRKLYYFEYNKMRGAPYAKITKEKPKYSLEIYFYSDKLKVIYTGKGFNYWADTDENLNGLDIDSITQLSEMSEYIQLSEFKGLKNRFYELTSQTMADIYQSLEKTDEQ